MHRILASRRERQLMLLGDAPRGAPSLWPPESAEAGDVADLQFSSKEFYTRGPGSAKVGANFLSEKWISAEGPSGDSSQAERRGRGRRSVPSASGLQDVPNGLRGNGIQERGKDNGKAKLVLQPQEDSESDARADREDDSLWESAGRDRKNPSTKRVPEKDGTETNLDEKLLEVGRQEQSSEVESGRQQTLVEQGEDVEDQAERALAQLKRDSEGEILRESPLSVFEPSGPGEMAPDKEVEL